MCLKPCVTALIQQLCGPFNEVSDMHREKDATSKLSDLPIAREFDNGNSVMMIGCEAQTRGSEAKRRRNGDVEEQGG